MRDEKDIENAIETYADMIKRICFIYLKNDTDTEDVFQNVFLKYYKCSTMFESGEHEKAWFIRVAINECKDLLKSVFRKSTVTISVADTVKTTSHDEDIRIREAVLNLPEKYRVIIYLHYFEGYSAVEISKMLSKNINTIYTLLSRGRDMLTISLGGEENE